MTAPIYCEMCGSEVPNYDYISLETCNQDGFGVTLCSDGCADIAEMFHDSRVQVVDIVPFFGLVEEFPNGYATVPLILKRIQHQRESRNEFWERRIPFHWKQPIV